MLPKQPLRPKSRDEFEIAIICALTLEADAVIALFDHHWDSQTYGKAHGDQNSYSTGIIGQHNVVLAHLPSIGKVAAGNIAAFCRMSYPNITLALVVGICGGAPFYGKEKSEILLGDVIISTGVVQYDLGRRFPDIFQEKDTLEESLGRPGLELRSLLSKLKTKRQQENLQIATQKHLQQVLKKTKISGNHLDGLHDNLFQTEYRHKHQKTSNCTICAVWSGNSDPVCDVALSSTCKELECDLQKRLFRRRQGEIRNSNEEMSPTIHFGKFGSGDSVIKSAEYRDQLVGSKDVIGFEMESAGVWEIFPCVVIKGVSDYADSHKNDDWHGFAAASAAACTRAFLKYWDSTQQEINLEVERQKLRETITNSLRFPEINERKNDLAPPAPDTFQWVLRTCSEDSDTKSFRFLEEMLGQTESSRKALFGGSHKLQAEDSSGTSHPTDDRGQGSDNTVLDYDENKDDEDNGKDYESDYGYSNLYALFSNSEKKWDSFTDWLASDHPCYWISGNAGSGKSTLMRYLLGNHKTSKYLDKWRNGAVILSHFFWKPGTQMQQSFKGLLCSLLFELLSKNTDAFQVVHDIAAKSQRLSTTDWSQQELSKALLEYCKRPSQPICFFIDGLDEALPGPDTLNTLQFLKSLTSPNFSVKICVSSRPERLFRLHFDTCPSLKMHELTLVDIVRYSRNAMVDSTLLEPRGETIRDLADRIARLSEGIFLWAVLVTQSLIRGINNGDSKDHTRKRLLSMPQGLMDLYHDILSRSAPDRPIYEKDISLVLNLLLLVAPWEPERRYMRWPLTTFMLATATNPDLLERYVERGESISDQELKSKVKSVKDIVESAFAGLLQVKYTYNYLTKDAYEEVTFPHRSVKDFLLDTVEGRNLWQSHDIHQEELLVLYFKSQIANARFNHENPESEISWEINIKAFLRGMFDWTWRCKCSENTIVSVLEIARVCFHRGHLPHEPGVPSELKPRCVEDQFPLLVTDLYYVRHLLKDHGAKTPEGMYCLLFNICGSDNITASSMQLIKYILEQGYSPNWNTAYTPTTGRQLVASPWFRFLISLLNSPQRFFLDKPEAERGQMISDAIQMFLKSGASLESIFPVVVRVINSEKTVKIYMVNQILLPSDPKINQYIILELNARAAIDLIKKASSFSQLSGNATVQPDSLTGGSYIRALAFRNGGELELSVINDQKVSDAFVDVFLATFLHRSSMGSKTLVKPGKAFEDVMEKYRSICPVVIDGDYSWRGFLFRAMNDLSFEDGDSLLLVGFIP